MLFENGTIVTGVGNPPKVWRLISSKEEDPSSNGKEHTGSRLRSRGTKKQYRVVYKRLMGKKSDPY